MGKISSFLPQSAKYENFKIVNEGKMCSARSRVLKKDPNKIKFDRTNQKYSLHLLSLPQNTAKKTTQKIKLVNFILS